MSDFDFSEIFRNLRSRGDRQVQAAIHAIDEFGEHVLGQAQQLAPVGGGSHSPRDPAPGSLMASATSTPAELRGESIEKTVGFNEEYAAVQHENLDFCHDVGEAKYLERPIRENAPKFVPFVADRVET